MTSRKGKKIPVDVDSFAALHDYVDANSYVADVGIDHAPGDYELINAVEDRVSEMLGQPEA